MADLGDLLADISTPDSEREGAAPRLRLRYGVVKGVSAKTLSVQLDGSSPANLTTVGRGCNPQTGDRVMVVVNGSQMSAISVVGGERTAPAAPRVGTVIIRTVSEDPNVEYPGTTWAQFATGRVLVGIDTGQTEFSTVRKTGGHKSLQSHKHGDRIGWGDGGGNIAVGSGVHSIKVDQGSGTDPAGGGNAENLQPYVVVYFWERTA